MRGGNISNYLEEKVNILNKIKEEINEIDECDLSFLTSLISNEDTFLNPIDSEYKKTDIEYRQTINQIEESYYIKQLDLMKDFNRQNNEIETNYKLNISNIETNYKTSRVVSIKNKRGNYYQNISSLDEQYQSALEDEKNEYNILLKQLESDYQKQFDNIVREYEEKCLENAKQKEALKNEFDEKTQKLVSRKESIKNGFENYTNQTTKLQQKTIDDLDQIFVIVRQNYQDTLKNVNSIITERQKVLNDSINIVAKYFKKEKSPYEKELIIIEEKYNKLLNNETTRHNDSINALNQEILKLKEQFEDNRQEITKTNFEDISVINTKLSLIKETQKNEKITLQKEINEKYKNSTDVDLKNTDRKALIKKFTLIDNLIQKSIIQAHEEEKIKKQEYQLLIYKNSIKHIKEIYNWRDLTAKEEALNNSNIYMLKECKENELFEVNFCLKTLTNMEEKYNLSLNSGLEIELDSLKLLNSLSKLVTDRESELLSNDLQLQKYSDQYDSENKNFKFNNEIVNLDYKIQKLAIEYDYELKRLTSIDGAIQNQCFRDKENILLLRNIEQELIISDHNIKIETTRYKYETQIEEIHRLIKELDFSQAKNQVSYDYSYRIENSNKLKGTTINLLNHDFEIITELLNKYKGLIDNDLNRNNKIIEVLYQYIKTLNNTIVKVIDGYQELMPLNNPTLLRNILKIIVKLLDVFTLDLKYIFEKFKIIEIRHNQESVETCRDSSSIKRKFSSTFFTPLISLNSSTINNNNIEIEELKKEYARLYDKQASIKNNQGANDFTFENLKTINQRIRNIEKSRAFYENSSTLLYKQIDNFSKTSNKKANTISKKKVKERIQRNYDLNVEKLESIVINTIENINNKIQSLESSLYVQSEQNNIIAVIKNSCFQLSDNLLKVTTKLHQYCKSFHINSKNELDKYLNTLIKEHFTQGKFFDSISNAKEKYLTYDRNINEHIMSIDVKMEKSQKLILVRKTKSAFFKKLKELNEIRKDLITTKKASTDTIERNNLILKSNSDQIIVNLEKELKENILKLTNNKKNVIGKNNKKIMLNNKEKENRVALFLDKENAIFSKFKSDKAEDLNFCLTRKVINDNIIKYNNVSFNEDISNLNNNQKRLDLFKSNLENKQQLLFNKHIEKTAKTLNKEQKEELKSIKKSYKYKLRNLA